MIVNYFELAASFELPPAQAIEFARAKGLKASFSYLDMVGQEHDAAFTVAKMMDTDLLLTIKKKVEQALANGTTLAEFKKDLIPQLQKAGWWGKNDVIDPLTGLVTKAQLGSASRLENIFRTNLQSAYSVGSWEAIEQNKVAAPYLMYDAVDDGRVRPEHAKLDGTILPINHIFWTEYYPPNGWGCRCSIIQLDNDDLQELGLSISASPKIKRRSWTNPATGKVSSVPENIDPGWNHNPGKKRSDRLRDLMVEKSRLLDPDQRAAVARAEGLQKKISTQYLSKISVDQVKAETVEPSAISSLVAGAAFESWLSQPEGFFPIGTISDDIAGHLGVSSNLVDVSSTTINTKLGKRPELKKLWKQIPAILRDGMVIDINGRIEVFYRDPISQKLYRLGIKKTSGGEVLVTSFYTSNERQLKRSKTKGRVIQEGAN